MNLLMNFEEDITLSQYKTRLGYLICYYFNSKKDENSFYTYIYKYLTIINIDLSDKDIGLFKKLRIITFYLREKVANKVTSLNLHFFEDLNPNNPYNLANKFNIEEINNLNELSRLFLAYIQFDSFILFNYCINEFSYSFSLENLYMIKFHLKSNYEEFFFTSREISDKYTYQAVEEKITIINEKTLFNREYDDKEIIDIEDFDESKHYALPISMEFRHEKNSHQKIASKNSGLFSPICYVRDLKYKKYTEKISINIMGKNGKMEKKIQIKGESGKMVESFISSDVNKINQLKTGLIYGDLFDKKLFYNDKFNDLFNKMDEIKSKVESKNNQKKNQTKKEETGKEKSDKDIIKSGKIKKIKDDLKKYEEFGFMVVGDVIRSTISRESIKFYKDSELGFQDKNKIKKDNDNKEK